MAVIVRLARLSDLSALEDLDPGRAASMSEWIEAGHIHVAVEAERAVGFAVMTRTFFERAFVELLMVAPSHRRRGVATAILRHLEARCSTADLWTSTNESNQPMRALLVAEGYTPSGTVEGLDEGDPELFFRKRVGSG
jgi:GNAT superfamily N-acetyltransferase